MAGPYPLATLGPTIDVNGISIPSYTDVLASLQASYQGIYGSDAYLADDSQDGQWLAIIAQAINDLNQACVAVFQGFSPSYSQGVWLSLLVKLNGLLRLVATNSSVLVTCVGQSGVTVIGGIIADVNSNQWSLPDFTFPDSGTIDVTALCAIQGAITVSAGDATIITVTNGWQTAAFASDATPGQPVEVDSALRARQAVSTSAPGSNSLDSIVAAVANIPGVARYMPYENDTNETDDNGLPPGSIALVIEGGDAQTIANTIALKKPPTCKTFGSTSIMTYDQYGVPSTINWSILSETEIYISLTLQPLTGYVSTTGNYVIAALIQWLTTLPIGTDVSWNKLWVPANLSGTAALVAVAGILGVPVANVKQATLDLLAATYEITALTVGTSPAPVGVIDVPIAFDAAADCVVDNIVLTVIS